MPTSSSLTLHFSETRVALIVSESLTGFLAFDVIHRASSSMVIGLSDFAGLPYASMSETSTIVVPTSTIGR